MAVVTPRRGVRRSDRRRWNRRLRSTLKVSLVVVIGIPLFLGGAVLAALASLLYGDLPGTVPEENDRVSSSPSIVLAADGSAIGEFREFDLTVEITPDDIPQVLKDAVVAAEDQQFWEHPGVDVQGLARAAVENLQEGAVVQGGSTITQQLVKNRYLTDERSLDRKLNEVILATRLEQELTKEEILFEYLDTTYFGSGAYGVGAAAETYFHKQVRDLNASESALLAGIIPAPSDLDPRRNPFGAEDRRVAVLANMVELNMISATEHDQALEATLWFSGFGVPDRPATVYHPAPEVDEGPYPYFLDYVERELVAQFGSDLVNRGGLVVETTLDPAMQEAASRATATALEGTAAPLDMAIVSVDPATGFVRAFVGGRDWEASQVNLALGGSLGMQPGSSFKPFVLAAALEQGIDESEIYPAPATWTVPECTGSCTISNYGSRGYGSLSLERAMWASVNTTYSALAYEVGPDTVAEVAHRIGVTSIEPTPGYGVSLALGSAEVTPLDMASAYATFSARGLHHAPTPLVLVTTADGTVLLDNTVARSERVIGEEVADHVTSVLQGVVDDGTGGSAAIDRPVAGKTGTAEDYQAAWFVGYTTELSTAVWMGFADQPRPLRDIGGFDTVTGGSIPATAFAAFMSDAHEGREPIDFAVPAPLPEPMGPLVIELPASREPIALPDGCGGLCGSASPTPESPVPQPAPSNEEPSQEESPS